MTKEIKCPSCGKLSVWNTDNPFRPFCCERCRLIDLGDWASESHRIAGDDSFSLFDSDSQTNHEDLSS